MPIIDLSLLELESNPHWSAFKVLAVMLFPATDVARENFLISVGFQAASVKAQGAGSSVVIDASATSLMQRVGDLDQILDGALTDVIDGSQKAPRAPRLKAGEVAGLVLMEAILADVRGDKNISLNRVFDLVSDGFRNGLPSDARPKGARTQDLKKHWKDFSSVAHLWAALGFWRALEETEEGAATLKPFRRTTLLPVNIDGLKAFIATAESFRERGERLRHPNARTGLLKSASTWCLSNDFSALRLPTDWGQNFRA